MSDEFHDSPAESGDGDALPRGVTLLVESALHSPPAPSRAEAASQERAVSAYQSWLTSPSALHSEPWRPEAGAPFIAKLSDFIRRLRDR